MSVTSEESKVNYVANGASTYAIPFKFSLKSHIALYVNDVKKEYGTDYQVSGEGNDMGGVLTIIGTPPDGNLPLAILREVPIKQGNTLNENGPFLAGTIEQMFDDNTYIQQFLNEILSRCIRFPVSSTKNPQLTGMLVGGGVLLIKEDGSGLEAGPKLSAFLGDLNQKVSDSQAARDAAIDAKNEAESAKDEAVEAKEGILEARDSAQSSAESASDSATAAAGSATASASSAAAALVSKNAAATSENNAANSATTASNGAGTATTKAAEALASKNAAALSETNSASSAADAAISEANAANSATAAATAAASVLWNDVEFITFADSPVTITEARRGKLLSIDCSSGEVVVNLPQISTLDLSTPWVLGVKKTDSSANAIKINRGGTDQIDGATSKNITSQDAGATLIPDVDPNPDAWTSCEFGVGGGGIGAPQGTRQTGVAISAANRITPAFGKATQSIFVKGNGGHVTVTNVMPIEVANMTIGQQISIWGTDSNAKLTLTPGVNLAINGEVELGKDNMIRLEFLGTDGTYVSWGEVGRNC
nr:hypothetical protein BHI3_07690 [Bacteriovorax sp. HI3]